MQPRQRLSGSPDHVRLQQKIIDVLERHGVSVPADVRARVVSCHDVQTLRQWLHRAAATQCPHSIFEAGELESEVERGRRRLEGVFRNYGLQLSDDQAKRIAECNDAEQLRRWTKRAVVGIISPPELVEDED